MLIGVYAFNITSPLTTIDHSRSLGKSRGISTRLVSDLGKLGGIPMRPQVYVIYKRGKNKPSCPSNLIRMCISSMCITHFLHNSRTDIFSNAMHWWPRVRNICDWDVNWNVLEGWYIFTYYKYICWILFYFCREKLVCLTSIYGLCILINPVTANPRYRRTCVEYILSRSASSPDEVIEV